MSKRMRHIPLCLLVLAVALFALAACTSSGSQSSQTTGAKAAPKTMQIEIVKQWTTSRHSLVVTSAAGQQGCKNCHDGYMFTTTGGGFQPRRTEPTASVSTTGDASTPGLDEGGGASVPDFTVATDCRVCHTGAGADIADKGSVDKIPGLPTAQGGVGAVCMACHNGWHASGKSTTGAFTAPHTSVQTDMLFAINTVDSKTPGAPATAGTKSPHTKVPDTCAGCHVIGAGTGTPNHTFRVDDFKGCQRKGCHKTDMKDGGIAKKDYDGNGTKETVAKEIAGLTDILKAKIEAKAGKFDSAHGQIVLASGAKPDDATYAAAYNYFFVLKDGSSGIHNTAFAVDLLTRSIQMVSATAP
jgi:hypothetical protein